MPPLDSAAVVAAVRDYVARAVAPLQAKLDALPPPIGMVDVFPVIAAQVAKVHEVAHEVALITFAEDIRKAVDALPKAKDGTSVGVEDIRPLIAEEVSKTVAALPKPRDGLDADMEAIGEHIRVAVQAAAPPPPKDGKSVTVEELRPLVVEEISNTLARIPKPKPGEPGRDAAQIEVAAAIDEGKSYPRGTYAKHANGLWRAYETTEGMRGWECLVAGVAGIEVLCNHEREFQVVYTLSDGKQFAQTFELPVLIYRGVFAEGREYHRGDQVSWGAHQWHCNEPTMEKPDTAGKAWTLAVKRGRDGKQGDPGKDGKTIVVKEKA